MGEERAAIPSAVTALAFWEAEVSVDSAMASHWLRDSTLCSPPYIFECSMGSCFPHAENRASVLWRCSRKHQGTCRYFSCPSRAPALLLFLKRCPIHSDSRFSSCSCCSSGMCTERCGGGSSNHSCLAHTQVRAANLMA